MIGAGGAMLVAIMIGVVVMQTSAVDAPRPSASPFESTPSSSPTPSIALAYPSASTSIPSPSAWSTSEPAPLPSEDDGGYLEEPDID